MRWYMPKDSLSFGNSRHNESKKIYSVHVKAEKVHTKILLIPHFMIDFAHVLYTLLPSEKLMENNPSN